MECPNCETKMDYGTAYLGAPGKGCLGMLWNDSGPQHCCFRAVGSTRDHIIVRDGTAWFGPETDARTEPAAYFCENCETVVILGKTLGKTSGRSRPETSSSEAAKAP